MTYGLVNTMRAAFIAVLVGVFSMTSVADDKLDNEIEHVKIGLERIDKVLTEVKEKLNATEQELANSEAAFKDAGYDRTDRDINCPGACEALWREQQGYKRIILRAKMMITRMEYRRGLLEKELSELQAKQNELNGAAPTL